MGELLNNDTMLLSYTPTSCFSTVVTWNSQSFTIKYCFHNKNSNIVCTRELILVFFPFITCLKYCQIKYEAVTHDVDAMAL